MNPDSEYMWECTVCGEPAYFREVIDKVETILCPKHLQERLGFRKDNDDKGQHNSK